MTGQQNHSGKGDNVGKNKYVYNIHNHPNIVPSKDLTGDLPSLINTGSVIGRQSDLERLVDALKGATQVALVNGLGGIGKSTLAKLYIAENYQHFDHIAWLSFTGKSFEDMVTSSLLTESLGLDRKAIAPDKLLLLIFQKLKDLKGNNLLVIDNADHTEEISKYRNRLPQGLGNWRVLITSRGVIEGFEQVSIDTLSPTDAKTLFLTHYPHAKSEIKALEELLNLVGLHTLTIELMAKTLAKSRRLKSVADLLEKIKDKKYEDSALLKEVWVEHKDKWAIGSNEEENRRIKGIYQYLLATFDLAELNGHEQWLLKQFAVLPPKPLEVEVFFEWLEAGESNIDVEKLIIQIEEAFESLVTQGWLQTSKNDNKEDSVLLHVILQSLVNPTPLSSIDSYTGLIIGFCKYISIDGSTKDIVSRFRFIEYAENFLKIFNGIKLVDDQEIKLIASLHDRLGYLYQYQGNYQKASSHHEIAINKIEKLPRDDNIRLALSSYKNSLATTKRSLGLYKQVTILLENSLAEIPNGHIDSPSLKIIIQASLGYTYQLMGKYQKAIKLLEDSLVDGIQKFGEKHPEVSTIKSNLGWTYHKQGRHEEAATLLNEALVADQQRLGDGHPDIAIIQSNLGSVYHKLEKYNEAKTLLETALSSDISNFGEDNPSTAAVKLNLGTLHQDLGNYSKAQELIEEALQTELQLLGENNPTVAITRSNLAKLYRKMGKYHKALPLFEEVLKSNLQNFEKHNITVALSQHDLAFCYYDMGDLTKTTGLLESLQLSEMDQSTQYYIDFTLGQIVLAKIYSNSERKQDAKHLLENILKSVLKLGDKNTYILEVILCDLASIYQKLGQIDNAKNYLENAIDTGTKRLGKFHPDVLDRKYNLGVIYMELGNVEKAKNLFEDILQGDIINYGEVSEITAQIYENLAITYFHNNRKRKAKKYAKKAYLLYLYTLGENYPATQRAKSNLESMNKQTD